MTDGEPETAVSASLQKIKSIKNQHKQKQKENKQTIINIYFFIFYFIKSQTSDSFVNHFDGHFAYLKTLDFSFRDLNVIWNDVMKMTKIRRARSTHVF